MGELFQVVLEALPVGEAFWGVGVLEVAPATWAEGLPLVWTSQGRLRVVTMTTGLPFSKQVVELLSPIPLVKRLKTDCLGLEPSSSTC